MTQVADPDQGNIGQSVLVEDLLKEAEQVLDVVAVAPLAQGTEVRKVPAD